MKRSNILLLSLSAVLLSGLFLTDHLLVLQYAKVDLGDRYKNFELLALRPFKALKITGGNGYAIRVLQGDNYHIRLMNSRKEFFKMKLLNDTLSVIFSVANQNYQLPEASTVGLIITVPAIRYLQLSGTNNEIGPFRQDSMRITQDKNTLSRLKELQFKSLDIEGTGLSQFDFVSKNTVNSLHLQLRNSSFANLRDVSFQRIYPILQDSAGMVFHKGSLNNLTGSNAISTANPLRDH